MAAERKLKEVLAIVEGNSTKEIGLMSNKY